MLDRIISEAPRFFTYYNMVFLNANFAAAPPAIYLPGPYTSRYFGGVKVSVRR